MCGSDDGACDIFSPEHDCVDFCSAQIGFAELRAREIGAVEHYSPEDCAFQVGVAKIGFLKLRGLKFAGTERSATELRLAGVAAFHQHVLPFAFKGFHAGQAALQEFHAPRFETEKHGIRKIAFHETHIPQL